MSALNKLAHLSLVNKVTTELENHIGIGDKTLSEFVIDLADKHSEPRSFQKALDEVGAELSFDLVRNLLEMIQRMRPKAGSKSDGERTAGGAASGSRARPTADDPLPGLSVRDDEARAKALTREIYGDNPITANMADKIVQKLRETAVEEAAAVVCVVRSVRTVFHPPLGFNV